MNLNQKKAQSMLEYVIILTAIIAIIAIVGASFIKPAVDTSLKNVESSITNSANKLAEE